MKINVIDFVVILVICEAVEALPLWLHSFGSAAGLYKL